MKPEDSRGHQARLVHDTGGFQVMISEQEIITVDDPRIVHRTRKHYALVLAAELFYVFVPPLGEPTKTRYHWTFGFRSRSAAVREARRVAKASRAREGSP
jgi:hypothetical protein